MKWPLKDFPYLTLSPITYLDSAATSQKPKAVIEAETDFYYRLNANIHRSAYQRSEESTAAYEKARQCVAQFIGALPTEIIFTSGATHGINQVAFGWGLLHLKPGDEILLSELEHHANLVPWQQVAQKTGAYLRFIPITDDGDLRYDLLYELITHKTKIVAITHASNAIGTPIDLAPIIMRAHAVHAKVLVDASQTVPHQPISVSDLDVDFLVFSGHKMLAPTGVGVLFVRRELQEEMAPLTFGGGAVYSVGLTHTILAPSPARFEPGTPPISQVIGLQAAILYLLDHDFPSLQLYEASLITQLIDGLSSIKGVTILGPILKLKQSGHLVSFKIAGFHAHDVAAFLDVQGIAVRAGHHCAQPLHARLGINASVRVSVYGYTSAQDIQKFLQSIDSIAL